MEIKTVYVIGIDKKYAGELTLDDTDKSPSGRWNIPANCTELKPLEEKEGFNVAWNGISWEYVEIPQEPIEPEPTAEKLQKEKEEELEQEYDTQLESFKNDILVALLNNNNDAIKSIQEEIVEFNAAYVEAKEKIKADA